MVYLLYGSDAFTRTAMLASFKSTFPPDAAAFNCVVLDGRTTKITELRAATEMYPMFHDHRLVIVHDMIKHAKSNDVREGLRAALQTLPPTTDLVLNESDTPDSRLAVVKDIQALAKQKHAEIRECVAPEGAALHQWIAQHAREHHATISPSAIQKLAEYVGNDMWLLHNEIVKLATFVGINGTINERIIEQLVADETETNLFSFTDALCARRGALAIQLLHSLLSDGAAPLYILAMIARQVRLMLAAQRAGRVAPDELARILGQKPFVARKAAEQARQWQAGELNDFHQRLVAIDRGIKTGTVDAEGSLAALVGELAFSSQRRIA